MAKHKATRKTTPSRPRNLVAIAPLMKKAEVHQKSKKAERRRDKVRLQKMPLERAAA